MSWPLNDERWGTEVSTAAGGGFPGAGLCAPGDPGLRESDWPDQQ